MTPLPEEWKKEFEKVCSLLLEARDLITDQAKEIDRLESVILDLKARRSAPIMKSLMDEFKGNDAA